MSPLRWSRPTALVAVAMVQGPAAGLVILDAMARDPRLVRWPPLHVGRADLLCRLGRHKEAVEAYQAALSMEPPGAERAFISSRIRQLAPPRSGRGSRAARAPE